MFGGSNKFKISWDLLPFEEFFAGKKFRQDKEETPTGDKQNIGQVSWSQRDNMEHFLGYRKITYSQGGENRNDFSNNKKPIF